MRLVRPGLHLIERRCIVRFTYSLPSLSRSHDWTQFTTLQSMVREDLQPQVHLNSLWRRANARNVIKVDTSFEVQFLACGVPVCACTYFHIPHYTFSLLGFPKACPLDFHRKPSITRYRSRFAARFISSTQLLDWDRKVGYGWRLGKGQLT